MATASVGQLLRERLPLHGGNPAFHSTKDGRWTSTSWEEFDRRARALGLALESLGLKKGDSVAIMADTREEWTTIDAASMAVGLIVVGIYHSNLSDSVEYILQDCDAKAIFVEDKRQLEKVESIKAKVPTLKHVFGIQPDGVPAGGSGYAALLEKGEALLAKDAKRWDSLVDAVKSGDLATLVYTSGTTGVPKGAMLSHANFTGICDGMKDVLGLRPTDSTVLFLPLAHIFARVVQFACLDLAVQISYPPYGWSKNPASLFEVFEHQSPTFISSVPRIFEKVYVTASAQFAEATGVKRKIIDFAMATGRAVSKLRQEGKEPSGLLAAKFAIANKTVFSKVKKKFGGNVRYFVSGGAPLSREIQEWFHTCDMLILEGYGLTETTAATCVNRPERFRFGTVGPAVPGLSLKIAEDGEILIKGVGVFQGYFKKPEDTASVLSPDGWFASGDIGEIDADGFLKITDRKKDLIVTAGGKNIAPQYVEAKLKTIPMISQVMVHGDKRKFVSALVTLNPDEVKKLGMSYEEAVKSPKVRELIETEVKARNAQLESYQQVKKFAVLEKDFSIDAGELTPTLKVKRKFVSEKYKGLLDGFYTESASDAA